MMTHGDAREGKWRGNWKMEWVAITLHTTSEHDVSSITTVDAHTSAASSRLNWRPRWFKWTLPFRRKTNSGFCACAITFQLTSNIYIVHLLVKHNRSLQNARYTLYQDCSYTSVWERSGSWRCVCSINAWGLSRVVLKIRNERGLSAISWCIQGSCH
jgi:hypothetical protein